MLSGIVLAAGEGRRMQGLVKQLLTVQGKPFLEIIIEHMLAAGVGELIVVLGANLDKVRPVAEWYADRGVHAVVNEKWADGQLSSLRAGLAAASPASRAAMLTLVDHPLVRPETYRDLAAAWRAHPDQLVMPSFDGRSGHPIVIPAAYYSALLHDDLPDGARGLLKRDKSRIHSLPVTDPGVVRDIDTPEDYRILVGGGRDQETSCLRRGIGPSVGGRD